MKYLNGSYYVGVKDKRYVFLFTEKIISRLRDPATSLRTEYQVRNRTQLQKSESY